MSLDVSLKRIQPTEVFSANITHNLNTMADEAGIYKAPWRPEEINVTTASQLLPILQEGLQKLRSNSTHFRTLNPSNGWGKYEDLIEFVEEYISACEEFPDAEISVSQ